MGWFPPHGGFLKTFRVQREKDMMLFQSLVRVLK